MEKSPEMTFSEDAEFKETEDLSRSREKKIAEVAMAASETTKRGGIFLDGEKLKPDSSAIEIVRDHFPDDISPKEHFEHDSGPNPLKTEEDFKKAFDLFLQEELIPIPEENGKDYKLDLKYWPYEETVRSYLNKTIDTIKDLVGESGKLPKTDVAIYLDKSARPVSWFVNELWEDVTDEPKPRTEHLAIDRRTWFESFGIEVEHGEYLSSGELAGWKDLPVHDVEQKEIMTLQQLLKDEVISYEELEKIIEKDVQIDSRIRERAINAVFEKEDVQGKIQRGEITKNEELEAYMTAALEKIKILDSPKLKSISDALTIAAQLRGLFVPGGLSEEDLKHPERIMDYSVDMEGKNITIVDEVARTGTTGEIAKHFVRWAFPEAATVSFYVFYEPKTLVNANSPMNGQMLRIPFWYSLVHDDGTERGILGLDKSAYEEQFAKTPTDTLRAAVYGASFLATPLDYETEKQKKSLRLREQIARLRVEYEKGHI